MATEVLRPQDCLVDRIRVSPVAYYHRRKGSPSNGNAHSKAASRKSVARLEKKFDNNSRSKPAVSDDSKKNRNNNSINLLMGQVTILKRGEALDLKIKAGSGSEKTSTAEDLIVSGTERLGPDPDLVPKQVRIGDLKPVSSPAPFSSPLGRKVVDMYAGSAFSMMSPSPSSLPLPSFFSKKQVSRIADDSTATRDLRRLLRLD